MIDLLQFAMSVGIFPLLLNASPQPGKIVQEISKQLHLSDGKRIGDCDAILVSSTGYIFMQHCSYVSKTKMHIYFKKVE